MIFVLKSSMLVLVFVTGILISYCGFLYCHDSSFVFTSESGMADNSVEYEVENHDEDQVLCEFITPFFTTASFKPVYFLNTGRIPHPDFAVWQPPKNC